jgi:hypothetical protein
MDLYERGNKETHRPMFTIENLVYKIRLLKKENDGKYTYEENKL